MKRANRLFEEIVDLDNLLLAFCKAKRGKQWDREVIAFSEHAESRLAIMRRQLLASTFRVGRYHYFNIHDPKERTICAATFEERVLHHAIMNVCHPYFDRHLIGETYATRPGKGVYKALDRAVEAVTCCRYIGKLDVRKYFDSIDHALLKQTLGRLFKDQRLLRLFDDIIDSYHKEAGKGLPIGNLTSQYFANLYLSSLDRFAKQELKCRHYVRYMDDLLFGASSRSELKGIAARLALFAQGLRLAMKPPVLHSSMQGIPFLGYRVMPHRLLLASKAKRRFRKYYGKYAAEAEWGVTVDAKEHLASAFAFIAHACYKSFFIDVDKHCAKECSVRL